jgi:hypothetical protein
VAELRQSAPLIWILSAFLAVAGCSRINELTPASLQAAQEKWNASGPSNYRMVIEMKGDRLESSQYAVTVREKQVVKLERNGLLVLPGGGGQDYSVEGLFHLLDLELDLAGKPEVLGAPPGYASYPMARFDTATGRLLRFQRSVGGTKNSIEINVKTFDVLAP